MTGRNSMKRNCLKIVTVLLAILSLGLGCQGSGGQVDADPVYESPEAPAPGPVPSPIGIPQIKQSLSFLGLGSKAMASESYRGVSSMGFYSQGVSEDLAFLMIGPSLAVEASVSGVDSQTQ